MLPYGTAADGRKLANSAESQTSMDRHLVVVDSLVGFGSITHGGKIKGEVPDEVRSKHLNSGPGRG